MSIELKDITSYILLFVLQVILDCSLNFGIYVHICIIPLIIMAIPYKWHVALTMPAAFLTGLGVDLATGGVLGANAAAAVAAAAFRNPIFRSVVANDGSLPAQVPSSAALGVMPYLKYLSLIILIYSAAYTIMDGLSFTPVSLVAGRIAVSAAISIAFCYWLNVLLSRNDAKINEA